MLVLFAMSKRDPLLDAVEAFLAKRPDVTPTAFGYTAVKDPRFVFDLRDGRECRRATRERVLAAMKAWPRAAASGRAA